MTNSDVRRHVSKLIDLLDLLYKYRGSQSSIDMLKLREDRDLIAFELRSHFEITSERIE